MNPHKFFTASRVVIVAGKGGVGKTTVTAVMARAAARLGQRVLVVEVEERVGLAALLAGPAAPPLDYREQELLTGCGPAGTGSVHACTVTAGQALLEYLDAHGLARVSKRLSRTGVFDVVSTAAPGIEDILVLGKVKQLERSGRYDLVVVDGPAAGHAISFLQAASGLLESVRVGPIETQAREVAEMLADPQRCQVLLVTLAEETPVNELVETSFALEDRVGVALAPVVVNAVYPDLELPPQDDAAVERAAVFRRERCAAQTTVIERLAAELPLAQIRLPFCFTASLDDDDVQRLVEEFLGQLEAGA